MLTPEYMSEAADGAEKAAEQLHNAINISITRRLMARAGRGEAFILTATDKWNIETLLQAGFLYEDILRDIASFTGASQKAVKQAMLDAGVRTLKNDQKIYDRLGIPAIDPTKSPEYIKMMQADYELTNGTIKNLTHTTCDVAQKTFINACDDIYLAVTRGVEGYESAIKKALGKIVTDDGVHVTYPSGAKTSVEAAVTRCVRTGVAQMAGKVSEQRARETGCEHYLVSSHMGARPTHAVWQGKVFKINGSDEKYKNFKETTGYGSGNGLCGWNCRHSFSPFFPEFMENNQDQYDVNENEEAYNKRQEQKRVEREEREVNRRKEAYKTAAECTDDEKLKKGLIEESKNANVENKRD